MSRKSQMSKTEELLIAISVSFGALFLATVITLIIARYFKKLRACCLVCMPCLSRTDNTEVKSEVVNNRTDDAKVPLMLSSNDEQPFIIPGAILKERVQPEYCSKENDEWPEASMQRHATFEERTASHHQEFSKQQIMKSYYSEMNPLAKRRPAFYTSEPLLLGNDQQVTGDSSPSSIGSPTTTRRYHSISAPYSPVTGKKKVTIMHSLSSASSEAEDENPHFAFQRQTSVQELRPELYDKSRKKSVGIGTLGKIRISLQFLDQQRSKLELLLKGLDYLKLQSQELSRIYVGIMMIPDRENMYRSKTHESVENPEFDEVFLFQRTQASGQFQSKTIRFMIYLRHSNDRNEVYGESRIQLAGREIFSKVRTNVVLNINPPSQLTEIGDLLMEIVYTDKQILLVFVKTMKLISTNYVENFLALQVKCFVKNKRRKLKPTSTAAVPVPRGNEVYVPINIELEQPISESSIGKYSLHVVVSGKHRIMGKKMHFGKVVLGNSAFDQSAILNWKNVMASPGMSSTLWHVIYAY